MRLSRRRFLTAGLLGVAGVTAGYARLGESGWLKKEFATIPLPGLIGMGLRMLVLTDLHYSSAVPLALIEEAVELGLAENPDVICLGGDFITAGERPDLSPYRLVLRRLSSRAPTFAVLGNHDGGQWSAQRSGGFETAAPMHEFLKSAGVTVLNDESVLLDSGLRLVGVADLWAGDIRPEKAFAHRSTEETLPTVVLAHNPDTKDEIAPFLWDLMISGHTHGGQIRLPVVGAPFVPVNDRRYTAGLNPWRDRWIYTSRGVGSLYGIRLNCRPEVTLLDLVPRSEDGSAGTHA